MNMKNFDRTSDTYEDDWSRCSEEVRCIWPGQMLTRPYSLTGKLYLHRYGWHHGMMVSQEDVVSNGY